MISFCNIKVGILIFKEAWNNFVFKNGMDATTVWITLLNTLAAEHIIFLQSF